MVVGEGLVYYNHYCGIANKEIDKETSTLVGLKCPIRDVGDISESLEYFRDVVNGHNPDKKHPLSKSGQRRLNAARKMLEIFEPLYEPPEIDMNEVLV